MLPLFFALGCGGRGADTGPMEVGHARQAEEPLVLRPAGEPARLAREVRFSPNDTLIPLTPEVREVLDPDSNFSLGLDRMVRNNFNRFDNRRVSVVTSRLAVDSEGVHLLESLLPQSKPIVSRVILFADENPGGARSRALNRVIGAYPSVRVFERSHSAFRLTSGMLDDTEILLVDLPLRGASFYPEVGFLGHVLQEASLRRIPVVVLDRPHPINGNIVEGPAGDPQIYGQIRSFFPDLLVMGLSSGELARFYNTEFGLNLNLEVVGMLHWSRADAMRPLWDSWDRLGIDPQAGGLDEFPLYFPRHPREGQWQLIADMLPSGRATVDRNADQSSLLLDPAPLSAEDFVSRANQFGQLEATLAAEESGQVRVSAGSLINEPVFLSVILAAVYGAADPSLLPEEGSPANYGSVTVAEMLRQGRNPREIRRSWLANPQVTELTNRRSRILR